LHLNGSATLTQAGREADWAEWQQDNLILEVRVQPSSSRLQIGAPEGGRLKIYLTAAPTDGKANQQACRLLAEAFGVGPGKVQLLRGARSRNKRFQITSPANLPASILARPNAG
jgi:uncharacterized protein (TIGR00251 family)